MTKPTSPFSKNSPVMTDNNVVPLQAPPQKHFPVVSQSTPMVLKTNTAISRRDIDLLGNDIQSKTGQTNNKIIDSLMTSQFGDLGDILSQVQNTAEKLDPSKKFGGLSGWFRSKVIDVKTYLRREYQSANKVFDALVTDMTKHIALHDTWIKNLDTMFEDNRKNYMNIRDLIQKAESWKSMLEIQMQSLPLVDATDPDAVMKAHERTELESLIASVDRKLDTFRRMKMICENNVPKIKQQQKTSEDTKSTLRNIIDFTIPVIRQEFASYIHSIQSQKSQTLIQNTQTLTQQTMIKSADAASEAAVSAAKNLNAPMIDNPTLDHLREKILFTVGEVRRVEQEAAQQRQADAASIEQSTRQFVAQLQSN